ncbi:MAG TPA: bifunctional diguanylate cyclase/phosphodiesterase [Bauldia sp.]|nr:bifunctional diguanylate cyclase/phosphodiesterase [Bauldia sp.]
MARAITGRITANLIGGIVITIGTVLITIGWMAHKHNEQAAESTQTMVVGGVQSMGKRLASLANDYGWWEEAYDAYNRNDKDWIDANVGTGITDTSIADMLAIAAPDGTVNPDYEWLIDGAPDSIDKIITPGKMAEIKKLADKLPVENFAAKSVIYIDTPSVPMMISIQHLVPVSKAADVKASDLPIIVFGQYLQNQRLHDLGTAFLIDDLHFVRATTAPGGEPAIQNLIGKTIGYFDWTPPKPGNALIIQALPPVSIALALFCVVALTTAFRARKVAIALTDSERQAVIAARTDSMTGLMNRTGFGELLETPAYERACAEGQLAVVYLDVNGFKAVNDSIGHHGGDDLVRALARRIVSILPEGASLARIGGDEFAVSLITGGNDATAAECANRIAHSIDKPFTICGFEFHVTISVGYAIAEEAGIKPSEVIRRADLAMYQAKNGAEREAVVYHPTMETGALEKKQIETGLRRAIERHELKVFYQPIVRASDGAVTALEALVRWTSPEFGAVSPALFIPVAEETGLIHDIGRFVVSQAAEDLHRWPGIEMGINVSPVQLRDPGFADEISQIVERHGHSPSRFNLELTEGILVTNPTIAQRKLAKLKEAGFELSLDDFGTGFSSIGYLRQFPFDTLKIDRSFVRDIGINATANALIQSLVSLGDALELSVIAEGIENEDQLKLLRLIHCEYVQGFLVSRPVPADDIDGLITERNRVQALDAHLRAVVNA